MKLYIFDAAVASILAAASLSSCSADPAGIARKRTELHLNCASPDTRAGVTDEDIIWDVNVFVLGHKGMPEQHKFIRYPDGRKGGVDVDVDLIMNRGYTLYAFANAGYDMGNMDSSRLEGFRFHFQRPDMSATGIPMSGKAGPITVAEGEDVVLNLKRLASKVTVKLDRSRLDDDVGFFISSVKVGNSPRWVQAYSPSAIQNEDDCFSYGYYAHGDDVAELYLPENLQGSLDPELCSYIELDIDYSSEWYYTNGKSGLIYRFYLREGNAYMVQRNCHYTVTVCPEKDGLLCEDSWRVDKSRLIPTGMEAYMSIEPAGSTIDGIFYEYYYEMARGGSLHFDLSYAPASLNVKLREDLVRDEMEDGRAEYSMDADGRGFTVRSLGGSGLSMMEIVAGPPLDQSETIVVYIE